MTDISATARTSQAVRVLVAILLLLSLVGGAGVAVADREDNSGVECPTENPTEAYKHASQPGQANSVVGRMTALEATRCLP